MIIRLPCGGRSSLIKSFSRSKATSSHSPPPPLNGVIKPSKPNNSGVNFLSVTQGSNKLICTSDFSGPTRGGGGGGATAEE